MRLIRCKLEVIFNAQPQEMADVESAIRDAGLHVR